MSGGMDLENYLEESAVGSNEAIVHSKKSLNVRETTKWLESGQIFESDSCYTIRYKESQLPP